MNDITFEKKYTFSGYGYSENGPVFKLDELSGPPTRHLLEVMNQTFTLTRLRGKRCIGRYDIRTFEEEPCPDTKRVDGKNPHCYPCFDFIGFNPAFYNVDRSELSPKQRDYNEHPHNVYLVYFTNGHVKVGISHTRRTLTRWLEQGARSGVIIKECKNAYEARDLEAQVVSGTSVTESMSAKQKRELLKYEYDPNNARNALLEVRAMIEKLLQIELDSHEVEELDRWYLGDNKLSTDFRDVSQESPLFISGTITGMIGSTLIFTKDGRQHIISLSGFKGHLVTLSEQLKDYPFRASQRSLF